MTAHVFEGACPHCRKNAQVSPKSGVERQAVYCINCGEPIDLLSFQCPICKGVQKAFVVAGGPGHCLLCDLQKQREQSTTISVALLAGLCAGTILLVMMAVDSVRKMTGPQSSAEQIQK